MALVHADGYGHYASAQYADVYIQGVLGATVSVGAYGPGGRSGFRFSGNYRHSVYRDGLSTSGAVCVMQSDFRLSAAPSTTNMVCGPLLGGDNNTQCCWALNSDRTISVFRGDASGTLLGTSTYVVPTDTHIHVGVKFTIHGSAGAILVHVWEAGDTAAQVVVNVTGANTQAQASATWDGFDVGAGCDGTTDFANLVVMDGSGSTLNDLLGPVDCVTLFASARAASDVSANWTLSSGTAAADLLDDATPDDETTYCESSTQNAELSVAVDPIPYPSRTILGAQLYASAKLTSGSPTVKALARDSSTSYLGSNVSPGAAYAYVMQPYSAMPSGAAFSTAVAFDALQWGLALTSTSTTVRLTQVAVVALLERVPSRHNLLTGYDHTVSGDDNLLAGQSNEVTGSASEAHGVTAIVQALRTVLFALTGVSVTETENGVFRVDATKIKLNGTLTLNGVSLPYTLDQLADVAIGSPLADGDVLTYDIVSGLWGNAPQAGGGDVSGPGTSVVDGHLAVWDGTSGTLIRDGGPASSAGYPDYHAPVNGDFAWVNQGGASITAGTVQGATALLLNVPANSGNSLRIRKKAAPSAPYTITLAYLQTAFAGNMWFGAGWRQSSDGKLVTVGTVTTSSFGYLWSEKWTNETTSAGATYVQQAMWHAPGVVWMQLSDDTTNRIWKVSADGQHWVTVHTVGRTDFLTADEVFFFCNANNGNFGAALTLVSWDEA